MKNLLSTVSISALTLCLTLPLAHAMDEQERDLAFPSLSYAPAPQALKIDKEQKSEKYENTNRTSEESLQHGELDRPPFISEQKMEDIVHVPIIAQRNNVLQQIQEQQRQQQKLIQEQQKQIEELRLQIMILQLQQQTFQGFQSQQPPPFQGFQSQQPPLFQDFQSQQPPPFQGFQSQQPQPFQMQLQLPPFQFQLQLQLQPFEIQPFREFEEQQPAQNQQAKPKRVKIQLLDFQSNLLNKLKVELRKGKTSPISLRMTDLIDEFSQVSFPIKKTRPLGGKDRIQIDSKSYVWNLYVDKNPFYNEDSISIFDPIITKLEVYGKKIQHAPTAYYANRYLSYKAAYEQAKVLLCLREGQHLQLPQKWSLLKWILVDNSEEFKATIVGNSGPSMTTDIGQYILQTMMILYWLQPDLEHSTVIEG